MLNEVIKKHKQTEFNRVNVKVRKPNQQEMAQSREAEREKRLKVSRSIFKKFQKKNRT